MIAVDGSWREGGREGGKEVEPRMAFSEGIVSTGRGCDVSIHTAHRDSLATRGAGREVC